MGNKCNHLWQHDMGEVFWFNKEGEESGPMHRDYLYTGYNPSNSRCSVLGPVSLVRWNDE